MPSMRLDGCTRLAPQRRFEKPQSLRAQSLPCCHASPTGAQAPSVLRCRAGVTHPPHTPCERRAGLVSNCHEPPTATGLKGTRHVLIVCFPLVAARLQGGRARSCQLVVRGQGEFGPFHRLVATSPPCPRAPSLPREKTRKRPKINPWSSAGLCGKNNPPRNSIYAERERAVCSHDQINTPKFATRHIHFSARLLTSTTHPAEPLCRRHPHARSSPSSIPPSHCSTPGSSPVKG